MTDQDFEVIDYYKYKLQAPFCGYLRRDVTHLEDSLQRVQVAALTLHNGAENETSDNLRKIFPRRLWAVITAKHASTKCGIKSSCVKEH